MTDLALALLRYGYQAIAVDRERAPRVARDVHVTRLVGRRCVVVLGREDGRLFYDETLVVRHRAIPRALAALLFGADAVHGLDGEAHHARKAFFLPLLQ